MKKVVLSLVAVFMLFAVSAQAQVFKLSLWGDICVPNEDYTGGLELGIGSETEAVDGVQWGIIYSKAGKLQGVQLGLVNNTDDGTGVQWGFVNLAQDFKGIQWGCVNWTKSEFTGAQLGFVNYAKQVTGLQWGFVNYTETMKGIQLGLVNIIKNNTMFLPVFVIFNFCF
ncbi:MAG: hypothetical protein K5622_00655 [Endomicrobiaceae bacterium]|nr:hypothetical protein [Endomicrobiaceae bacterium]